MSRVEQSKPIPDLNRFDPERHIDWSFRLSELAKSDERTARFLAAHHIGRTVAEKLSYIRLALGECGHLCELAREIPKREVFQSQRDAAFNLFSAFEIAPRLMPGVEALRRLCGTLPDELEDLLVKVSEIFERVEVVRLGFYSQPAKQRRAIDLYAAVQPYYIELRDCLYEFERVAFERFGLDPIRRGLRHEDS